MITIITTSTVMPTDARLLTLAQWMSPAFPIGAFAFSHGLETAIDEGWVSDATTLEAWLRDCLTDGSGRADAIWLRLAYGAEDPRDIDAMARAFIPCFERRREAERQGEAFVTTVNAVWTLDMLPMLLPVAVGHAAARAGLELEDCVALYLQGFVANLVSAALRLMPLGQTAGQRVILSFQEVCLSSAVQTKGAQEDDVFGNAFLSDIAAMRHETLEPRLFQS